MSETVLGPGELVRGHERPVVRHISTYVRQAVCSCGYVGLPRDRASNSAATAWCQDDLRHHLMEEIHNGAQVYPAATF